MTEDDDHALARAVADLRALLAPGLEHYRRIKRREPANMLAGRIEECRRAARALIDARPPDLTIYRQGERYLQRWWLAPRTPNQGRAYLHRFLQEDERYGLHDHPWDSASLTVRGTCREHWRRTGDEPGQTHVTVLGPGHVALRPAEHAHRIEPIPARDETWTVFVTMPKVRGWGFWEEYADGHRRFHPHEDVKKRIGQGRGPFDTPVT